MNIEPEVGLAKVPITWSNVDFPLPEAQTIPNNYPCCTFRETPANARTGGGPGYSFTTFCSINAFCSHEAMPFSSFTLELLLAFQR